MGLKYVVSCKSNFTGRRSTCMENDRVKYFETEKEAEEYANECRNIMGVNYHYWVEKQY